MSSEMDLVRDLIHTLGSGLTSRLDNQDAVMAEVLKQTKATNGRVTALEQREKERARRIRLAWRVTKGLAAVCATTAATIPLWIPFLH